MIQIVEPYVQQLPLQALRFWLLLCVNKLSISFYMCLYGRGCEVQPVTCQATFREGVVI